MTSPKQPTRYVGPNVYIANTVVRNRAPTGADFRQPETGKNYVIFTSWQVGKDPTTGTEGDLWLLSKIVANVAFWIKISSGGPPAGGVLTLSDTANTLVFPETVGNVGNIQLSGSTGITVTADPSNHKLVFALAGGGTGAIEQIQVQSNTAPGVNPVNPAAGLMTVNGAVVANHSVVLETRTRALNAFNVEVQYATTAATTDGTKSGVAHFKSTDFIVDGSGFVSLVNGPVAGVVFSAYNGANITNTTGDGTQYTVVFDTTSVNDGAAYNTGTGLFTAPSSGNYLFTYTYFVTTSSTWTALSSYLIINGVVRYKAIPQTDAPSNQTYQTFAIEIPLTINDTVGVVFAADTAAHAKNTTISGDGTNRSTTFTGYKINNPGASNSVTVAMQVFTSNGTYTPTLGMHYCVVEIVGGGGGGGGVPATGAAEVAVGGGGAGGGYSRGVYSAATIGVSQAVTIGAGGTSGPAVIGAGGKGGTGGTSSLGALQSATGGQGGDGTGSLAAATIANGGFAPGIGVGGSLNIKGESGFLAWASDTLGWSTTGQGGSSYFGTGGVGSAHTLGVAGEGGKLYGGGGGGAANFTNQAGGHIGGVGADGVIVITEFI